MSELLDTDQFGKASVEAGQGYQAMPDPRPTEADNAERANAERTLDRLNTAPEPGSALGEPLPVHYHEPGDPNKTSDPKLTLTPERAAEDLGNWRRGMEDVQRAVKDADLATEIDALKAAQPQPQAPQEPQQQPQPEPPPLPPELQNLQNPESAELVAALQREPRILDALNTLSWQHDQKIAAQAKQALEYTQAVEQHYSQYTQANANIALAAMFSSFPELRGMTVEQINAATPIIERTNPERGAQIRAHVAQVSQLANEARQVQAAHAQQRQQQATAQFQNWASQQDDAFEAATKSDPPQRQTAIRNEAHRMLREYGMSDQEIAYNWQTNPMLRSRAAQMILRDAALYRMAQRTARPAPTPPVRVQTPGPRGTIATEDDADLRSLSQRLNQSHSAKDAAALLSARRSRSR